MPADLILLCTLLFALTAACVAILSPRLRKLAAGTVSALALLFLGICLLPGWWFWLGAVRHDPHSELMLGHYYNSRLGYLWIDIRKRDRWWLEAARHGNMEATFHVGYHSIRGSSALVPANLEKARDLLGKSLAAGYEDAAEGLRSLESYEAYQSGQRTPRRDHPGGC